MSTARATLMVNPGGFAFAHREDGERSIFIPPRSFADAIDGDKVEVAWTEAEKGPEGYVLRVVERKRTRLVGVLDKRGRNKQEKLILNCDDPRILGHIDVKGGKGAAELGQLVAATIVSYPDDYGGTILVEIERPLGEPGNLDAEVARILIDNNIEDEFPQAVLDEAETFPPELTEADLEGRADLRGLAFMTIDPTDARDFDDAVCVELRGENVETDEMRIWVAVADVSHYCREGTAIDDEAQRRRFSTYLPNRAVPMLPERLSTHLCSLVPKQDRPAMVCAMNIDASGAVSEVEVMAAVIHSRRRLSYDEVAEELDGAQNVARKVHNRLLLLRKAADRLRAKRLAEGAVELNLPESKVILDEDDPNRIRDVISSRSSKSMARAYNLIEEFMLAANRAVGALAVKHKLPLPFRIHDKPDEEKLAILGTAAYALGVRVDPSKLQRPKGVQQFLAKIQGKDRAQALNMLMLRAMAQAEYSTENVGHFALAMPAYAHFTSPIRRYPDLVVHRVLKAHLAKTGGQAGPRPAPAMPKLVDTQQDAADSSERERASSAAERQAHNVFAALYMRDRVGDRFDGTVSGFSQNGIFVTIAKPFVDGMVRIDQLQRHRNESYTIDETGVRLVGKKSGRAITVGDPVIVEVESVSIARGQIDLWLAGLF